MSKVFADFIDSWVVVVGNTTINEGCTILAFGLISDILHLIWLITNTNTDIFSYAHLLILYGSLYCGIKVLHYFVDIACYQMQMLKERLKIMQHYV